MPQINPQWLISQAPRDLKAQIQKAISCGYHVMSQTATTAQLVRKKEFSCLFAVLSLFFFGIGFLFYIFYYLAKKDDAIYLDIETQPSKEEMREMMKKQSQLPWHKKYPFATILGALLLLFIVIAIISSK